MMLPVFVLDKKKIPAACDDNTFFSMSSSCIADENVSFVTTCMPETVHCIFNRLHGCSTLCSGHSGGGREVVDGMMVPDWLGLTEGSDITWRRGPVV